MIELTVLNDSNVELNTVDDGLIGLDVVMATGGGSEINNQNKTVTPTESEQSVTADAGYTGLGTVTVEGIDPEYVGSDVPRKSSSDLTAVAFNVIVPKGYYESNATKSVAKVEQGIPVATKGNVSNHSVSVTPEVTNVTGWITNTPTAQNPTGTVYGTPVSVSASELVSGTKSISANGTEDVTNYASVSVAVPQPSGTKNITISANGTTTEDVTSYASASITANVPNTYSASDEGKVVDNGALVSQTSDTVTANDTYDTTLINSLTVNVSGGGSTLPKSGTFTPASNTTNMGTIDTGTDFTHFVLYTTSGVTGNSVKALKGVHFLFNGNGSHTNVFMVSTNNAGSSYAGYASLTSYSPSKSGNSITWSSMGTSGTAAGYLLSGKTYNWYAW